MTLCITLGIIKDEEGLEWYVLGLKISFSLMNKANVEPNQQ
jgi:hypothetical protein